MRYPFKILEINIACPPILSKAAAQAAPGRKSHDRRDSTHCRVRSDGYCPRIAAARYKLSPRRQTTGSSKLDGLPFTPVPWKCLTIWAWREAYRCNAEGKMVLCVPTCTWIRQFLGRRRRTMGTYATALADIAPGVESWSESAFWFRQPTTSLR